VTSPNYSAEKEGLPRSFLEDLVLSFIERKHDDTWSTNVETAGFRERYFVDFWSSKKVSGPQIKNGKNKTTFVSYPKCLVCNAQNLYIHKRK
jgi:hypothetical protein